MIAKWIERFSGHFYLDIVTHGYDVRADFRGDQPIAIVNLEHGGELFFERCTTLDEAKEKAVEAYRAILANALKELPNHGLK
jgi:hypothetical protein